MRMKVLYFAVVLLVMGVYATAQQSPAPATTEAHNHDHDHNQNTHEEEYGAQISYAELQKTVEQIRRMRDITAKYRNVKVAQADGYVGMGEEIKGMGIHFVREMEGRSFDLNKPSMLVYEKTPGGGYSLAGLVYLLKGDEGPDGQPVNNPFPKPLAIWHKHAHVCQLNERDHVTKLSEEECIQRGGHFNTNWMIHAWVWKDSPRGVFSPKNPLVAQSGADVEIHTK